MCWHIINCINNKLNRIIVLSTLLLLKSATRRNGQQKRLSVPLKRRVSCQLKTKSAIEAVSRQRATDGQTEQIDRQTGRQAGRQTDRQTNRLDNWQSTSATETRRKVGNAIETMPMQFAARIEYTQCAPNIHTGKANEIRTGPSTAIDRWEFASVCIY